MMSLQMVDLRGQYLAIKDEIDAAIQSVIDDTAFIRGAVVGEFECKLAEHLQVPYALGVANGTDALQVALMALGVGPGDEVITPSFTFVATAEAAALLGAEAVFADIEPDTFNIDPSSVDARISLRTKAIVPVHLFGQPAEMDDLFPVALSQDIPVVEDNAQAIGARYKGNPTGSLGDVACLSFFPSKNLGAYGDGGAITTRDESLYRRCRMIANHGSEKKYHNEMVGVNSRLDTLQAAILQVKLRYLERYSAARRAAADRYDERLDGLEGITVPHRAPNRTHVFHQYTIRVAEDLRDGRDGLARHLKQREIPHAVYYPVPLHRLPVFASGDGAKGSGKLPQTERASREVLSLPMHTELTVEQQERITEAVREYVRG